MKIIFTAITLILCTISVNAQNILFVNDNDALPQNTDSIINAMTATSYSITDYWSIPDSAGVGPDFDYMDNFDLVIWYCSTDGGGLGIWDGTAGGNAEVIEYILTEKPIWIIGLDMLFELYAGAPEDITAGDFAYDYMGIDTYNVQSYGDDSSTGLPQADTSAGCPPIFPDSLIWDFATQWWVDGVTPRAGVIPIYDMGPASYVLAGEVCMLHNTQDLNNVMTTLFDPALIKGVPATGAFLEAGITYLLPEDLNIEKTSIKQLSLYPNPTDNQIYIEGIQLNSELKIYNTLGELVSVNQAANGKSTIFVGNFEAGLYYISCTKENGETAVLKFIKE